MAVVGCPDPEELAQLASAGGSAGARAIVADHAASCEACHAALVGLLELAAGTMETVHTHTPGALGEGDAPRATERRIDRYRIKRRLGSGGMGIVYVAHDPELDRDVAIKVLHRGAAAERLRREAKALARLSHPNVVAVHDVGEHDGQTFVAMALVDGDNLRQWLTSPRSATEILRVLTAAARGIVAAHAAGLIHRDLKPDNIFVSRRGEVLVGDFGLARDATDDAGDAGGDPSAAATGLTMTGAVLGTPAYMAPEQAAGAATAHSDQFSFCVTAYEALYGTRPFIGASFEELLDSVERGVVARPVRTPRLPATVERALRRGLRADPAERFATMAELVATIDPKPRRWPYVAAAVGAVGIGIAATIVITRGTAGPDPRVACAATSSELDAVWSPARRTALTTALRAHGTSPEAIVDLDRELAAYATRWTTARRETCLAEVARQLTPPQLAGRLACLETRRTSLDVQIASLVDHDADAFTTWQRVVSLPPIEACRSDDVARLSSGTTEHQTLMRDLAVAMNDSRAALGEVSKRAVAAHDPAAQLEIALIQASYALNDGVPVEADAALARARPLAETLDAASTRVRAFALSARSLCLQNRNAEATTFLTMAEAGAQRLREDDNALDLDEVLHARAECHYRSREFAQALPLLVSLLERAQRRHGPGSLAEYELRTRLGLVYVGLDRLDDARREQDAWYAIWRRIAPETASIADDEDRLSLEALERGDLDGAIDHQRRSAALFAAQGSPDQAAGLVGLAMLYEVAAEPRAAIGAYTEALGLIPADTVNEDAAAKRIEAFDGRGLQRMMLGELDGAIADLEVAIREGERWHQTYYVASSQVGLGRAWVGKGEYARAVRILRGAVPAYARLNNASPFRIATGQLALAQALWETGDLAAARTIGAQAETTAALALERAQPALGRRLIPQCVALLASVERWRDTHR